MEKQSMTNDHSEPNKNGLIVIGGQADSSPGPWCDISRSAGSRESARLIKSPCRSGISTFRASRACVWI